MSSIPLYNVQARFKFYTSEDNLSKEWKSSAKSNTHQTTFLEGILLKSLEKNAQFSYVDYSVFFSGIKDFKRPAQPRNHVQSDVLRVHNHKFSIDVLGNRILQPEFYDEIECIVRDGVKQLPRTPVSKDSLYFLTSFHALERTQSMEEIWSTWSGAKFILWNCPKVLNLRRITFLKATMRSENFAYLILCECENGMEHLSVAMDFYETLKTRRCGLVGLYKVERYYIPPHHKTDK